MGKKVLITSDMHTGSTVAVFPECAYKLDYEPQNEQTLKMDFIEDKTIRPNAVSKFLYKKYQEMCDDVGKVDIHIHLSETCEGYNAKAHGKETYTTDLLTQASTSVYLETLIKARRREIMQASFYHVYENMSTDEVVAKLLGAGHHVDLKLTVDKLSCYFRHPIGSTRGPWMYKPTKVAREMMLGELNKEEYGKFNIYGFGHVHSFVGVEYGSSYGFTCPGWKGRDDYAKRGSLAWLPQCGYMLFDIKGTDFDTYKHIFVLKGKQIIDEVKI